MRVRNLTDSALGLNGVSIPPGQSRTVKGLDPEQESVKARIEAGDIEVPGYEKPMYVQTEPELPDDAKAEDYVESPPSRVNRLFGARE